jgi:hypothetical protein
MLRLLVVKSLLLIYLVALSGCSQSAHLSRNYVYQYTLVALEPLENYGDGGIGGPRGLDIPIGDTLVAESASFLTGVPAYSLVLYQQKATWVFGALSKTSVVGKKK